MSEALEHHVDPELVVQRYVEDPRPDLKDVILVQYSGMVERIARRFSGAEPFEDLVQVGYIGLLNALSKFDPGAGVRFNTYATHLVAGEIKHYLRDRTQTIRQPAWLQELRHRVNKAATVLQSQLGRVPTEREIADEIGVSEAAVVEVFQTQQMLRVDSIDRPSDEEGGEEPLDAPADCRESLTVEDRVVLEAAIHQLRDLERQVLVHFHFDAMSQTEIANKLGISCNYVSHILRQSLSKLRRILANEEEKERRLQSQADAVDSCVVDSATGVYTHEYFLNRLGEEVHRASGTEDPVAVLTVAFLGLDKLQEFYGKESVRDFLADAAEVLKLHVRRLDVPCRYTEEGFGIVLRATGTAAPLVRRRIHQVLNEWLATRNAPSGPISVETSFAIFPDHGLTVAELLAHAQPTADAGTEKVELRLESGDRWEPEEKKAA